jgi:hypothetical protein
MPASGPEARHQIDLEGRQLQHIDAVLDRLAQQEHRLADIAADIAVTAGRLEQMAGERRRRRFAVGAGDRHELGATARELALKDFRVADDFDACGFLPSRPSNAASDGVSGTPGLNTSVSSVLKSNAFRSPTGRPSAFAFSTDFAWSSQAKTSAPPSRKASAQAVPERASRRPRLSCPRMSWLETSAT